MARYTVMKTLGDGTETVAEVSEEYHAINQATDALYAALTDGDSIHITVLREDDYGQELYARVQLEMPAREDACRARAKAASR